MKMNRKYGVRVPATTANIGSGFDTLGMALGLYNEAYFTPVNGLSLMESRIDVQGEGAGKIKSGIDNMILQAMQAVSKKIGKAVPGGELELINRIPLARGMGSSSAALVSGAYLANQLCGNVLNKHEILNIVTELEGHPDNVAPAMFGGFCLSVIKNKSVLMEQLKIPDTWKAVVAVPDFELRTEDARRVLPDTYSREDSVQNIGAVSFLMAAIMMRKGELLKAGLADRIHVPYRLPLISGAEEAMKNADKKGCYGVTISGSGPTIIAFSPKEKAYEIGVAMADGFKLHHVESKFMVLDFDQEGGQPIQLDNY